MIAWVRKRTTTIKFHQISSDQFAKGSNVNPSTANFSSSSIQADKKNPGLNVHVEFASRVRKYQLNNTFLTVNSIEPAHMSVKIDEDDDDVYELADIQT